MGIHALDDLLGYVDPSLPIVEYVGGGLSAALDAQGVGTIYTLIVDAPDLVAEVLESPDLAFCRTLIANIADPAIVDCFVAAGMELADGAGSVVVLTR